MQPPPRQQWTARKASSRWAEAMANRATDPSLVQRVAEVSAEAARLALGQAGSAAAAREQVPNRIISTSAEASVDASSEGKPLQEALLCLEWRFPGDEAASQGQADYLDGSCLVYAEDRLIDVVDFQGAHSATKSCSSQRASSATFEWSAGAGVAATVLHSGDVMSADGGTHVIRVCLSDLPPFATDCFFVISAYNCRNLSAFRSLGLRLLDPSRPAQPLSYFSTKDAGHVSAVVVCSLTRKLNAWIVRRICRTCDATVRDYSPIEAAIAPVQANHGRWRRRKRVVLLHALWETSRASPAAEQEDDRMLLPLFRLPALLFRSIVLYL